jgi:hypothetical protein
MRGIETIDSELGVLLAIRHGVREEESRPPEHRAPAFSATCEIDNPPLITANTT